MPTQIAAQRTRDDIFQPGRVVAQSDPDRLASIATLFGMKPQPIGRCRVLEIGSWAGRNLLPMAERHPESSYVGVDGSADRVAAARQLAASVELKNIEFHNLDLDSIDQRLGTFDYIVCHDIFSRITPELQDTLLSSCQTLLNAQGVMYLSYHTLPGWSLPGILRDMAQQRTPEGTAMAQRVAEARKAMQFVFDALPRGAAGYRRLLRNEAELALHLNDASLVHEHLGGQSHPVYFYQFVEHAAAHKLQTLGDADVSTMFAARLGPAVEGPLMQIARDGTSQEQHMDLLRNRSFRRSLLCHQDLSITRHWLPARLHGLYLAGNLRQQGEGALTSDETARFVTADDTAITTSAPAVKIALAHLGQEWPRATTFDQLAAVVDQKLAGAADHPSELTDRHRDELGGNLIECIANGLIEPRSEADRFVTEISERPLTSPWARTEAQSQPDVANRLHEQVRLDEMSHSLLHYVDGKHDRAALLAVVVEAASQGKLSILRDGIPTGGGAISEQILDQVLEQCLAKLAHSALLVS